VLEAITNHDRYTTRSSLALVQPPLVIVTRRVGACARLSSVHGRLEVPRSGVISSLLLTVDWFLDRCRTMINVLGDVNVACLLDGKQREAEGEATPEVASASVQLASEGGG
jgi:Na+/H+-dicarboxylate symporter